ncbi:bile acid:sodium symporter family protein [Peptococcaceae bacterium 1198_IL3148]
MINRFTELFPLWAILLSIFAYLFPQVFLPFDNTITPLLGLVMFGMGITLTIENFQYVIKKPKAIIIGTILQFLLMPLLAWLIAGFMHLPTEIAIGLILVGCCPGGTASNVICYLARGDLALSITLTSISTLLATIMTPFLAWLYIGQTISVPVGAMLLDIVKIVIVPVIIGLTINSLVGQSLDKVKKFFPLLSMMAIIVIIAIIVAVNKDNITNTGVLVMVAVIIHNLLGLTAGYGLAKLLALREQDARTIAIEVGMQNSGLGVALAIKYFYSAAALPGAIFSIWHNISGSLLAAYFSKNNKEAVAKSK